MISDVLERYCNHIVVGGNFNKVRTETLATIQYSVRISF